MCYANSIHIFIATRQRATTHTCENSHQALLGFEALIHPPLTAWTWHLTMFFVPIFKKRAERNSIYLRWLFEGLIIDYNGYANNHLNFVRLGLHAVIFFLQVSVDNSAEEADHIEISGPVTMRSTAIFSPHVFAENGQIVHIKSRWCV